ncbi:MAG TPA: hypothetical protein VFD72_05745 [Sphingobacteriaceae bacterium]|nr:hypothetical protein [Sphingobacteriaceae bacterium]
MKKLIKNTSPYLLLTLPFFVAMVFLAIHTGNEMIQERIQLSASYIAFPKLDVFQVILRMF